MTDPATDELITAAEYLAWEREQLDKHEFHDGEVFAMAGGSLRHAHLAATVISGLHVSLADHGCDVFSSDVRIVVAQGERYVYPDATVVCDGLQAEPGASDVLTNPAIIVEVLSPSTEAYDRGAKWAAYQRLPSLTDYLLVSQNQAQIEHFRREPDGSWRYTVHEAGGLVELTKGGYLDVDAIYKRAFQYDAS